MHLLLTWTRRVAMMIVLVGGASGPAISETRVSTSSDPSGGLGSQMSALLGQERAAIGQLASGRLEQLLVAPTVQVVPAVKPVQKQAVDPVVVRAEPSDQATTVVRPALFWLGTKAASPAVKAPATVQLQYDAGWLAGLPAANGDAQWECLARALYFEARGESVAGQFAVGEVVLNRVDSGMYPRSVCGVVNQGSKYACQFSFVCDGQSDKIRERAIYQQVGKIAELLLEGAPRNLTKGATHFRTGAVRPGWSRTFPQTAKIGAHYFYRQPLRLASN